MTWPLLRVVAASILATGQTMTVGALAVVLTLLAIALVTINIIAAMVDLVAVVVAVVTVEARHGVKED